MTEMAMVYTNIHPSRWKKDVWDSSSVETLEASIFSLYGFSNSYAICGCNFSVCSATAFAADPTVYSKMDGAPLDGTQTVANPFPDFISDAEIQARLLLRLLNRERTVRVSSRVITG